jgi:Na+-driven multidrug efflux pump
MFQAIGNTIPSLAASASRLFTFALPAVWMSSQPWFELHHLWYLSVATVLLQAATAWWLLSREMKIKLQDAI